jgi:hypothetical protein
MKMVLAVDSLGSPCEDNRVGTSGKEVVRF